MKRILLTVSYFLKRQRGQHESTATTCLTPCSSALQVPLAKHLAMDPIASHPWGAESEGLICILLCPGLDILMFSTRCLAESSLRLLVITLTMVPSNSHVFLLTGFASVLVFIQANFLYSSRPIADHHSSTKPSFVSLAYTSIKWPIVNAFSPMVSNKPCTFQIFLSKT